jgi:hypothetical protein
VVTFHPQGHVDEGHHKVLRCNETRKREIRIRLNEDLKKINKGKIFFLGVKIMMRRLNVYG